MIPNIGNNTAGVNGYLTASLIAHRRFEYRPMLDDVLARVESRLRALGLTPASASTKAGLSKDAIRNMQRAIEKEGRSGVSTRTISALAPVLETTAAWLLTGEGGSPAAVQLVGKAGAGPDGEVVFSEVDGGLGSVAAPNNATPSTKGLEVSGDSMRGVANDGWLIFYDEDGLAPAEEMIGELCVCWLEDGRTLIKFLQPGRDGTFDLESPNAPTMRDVSLKAAALVTSIVPRKSAMKMMKANPAVGKHTAVMK